MFLSDNLTYRDTVCTTGGYSATFSIQISMLNSCMEYYQNILTWNIKTFEPKYKERWHGVEVWSVDRLTEVLLMLLFSVLERREQWVRAAWTDCGAIKAELNQQLYNYSLDKITGPDWYCTVDYEYWQGRSLLPHHSSLLPYLACSLSLSLISSGQADRSLSGVRCCLCICWPGAW